MNDSRRSDRDDAAPLAAAEQRARDAVRSLSRPAPDAAFRAELGDRFAQGVVAPPVRRLSVMTLPSAHSVWRAAAIPLAAAAVLLVVSVFNRGPAWQLVSATGEGIAVVDGRPVAMSNAAELARLLRPGVRVRMPEGCEAELVSREQLAIQITGGSDVTIPDVPGRFWSRDVRSEVGSGEIRVTSGDAFRGARLSVITPEARVEMTGTTLAVIREPAGTCVCVLEGRVKVGPRDGELLGVDAGMRRFIFNDERSPELAPMRDAERTKLGMFRDARRESMTN